MGHLPDLGTFLTDLLQSIILALVEFVNGTLGHLWAFWQIKGTIFVQSGVFPGRALTGIGDML
jgi:hypothetical protein